MASKIKGDNWWDYYYSVKNEAPLKKKIFFSSFNMKDELLKI